MSVDRYTITMRFERGDEPFARYEVELSEAEAKTYRRAIRDMTEAARTAYCYIAVVGMRKVSKKTPAERRIEYVD